MPKKIKTVGGNLFRIAAETLGDATQANRIATANNVTDPFLVGAQTVTIPTVDLAATGGEPFGPITQQPAAAPAPVEAPVPPTPPVIPPAVVNNPPQTKGPWFVNVLSAWQPIPPVPTLTSKRSPAGLAVAVNAPIPGGQIDPQGHVGRSWIPPDPLPNLGTNLSPSLMAVQVDKPIPGGQINPQYHVRFAWIPPDPLPTLATKLPLDTTAVAVSVWPGGSFLNAQQMSNLLVSWWQPPSYVPALPDSTRSAPLFSVRVDDPPFGIDYQPFQVRPEIAPPRQKDSHIYPQQIVSVNAPPPQSVASDMVSIGQRWHQLIPMPIVRTPRFTPSGALVGTPPSTSGQFLVVAGGR